MGDTTVCTVGGTLVADPESGLAFRIQLDVIR